MYYSTLAILEKCLPLFRKHKPQEAKKFLGTWPRYFSRRKHARLACWNKCKPQHECVQWHSLAQRRHRIKPIRGRQICENHADVRHTQSSDNAERSTSKLLRNRLSKEDITYTEQPWRTGRATSIWSFRKTIWVSIRQQKLWFLNIVIVPTSMQNTRFHHRQPPQRELRNNF